MLNAENFDYLINNQTFLKIFFVNVLFDLLLYKIQRRFISAPGTYSGTYD